LYDAKRESLRALIEEAKRIEESTREP
jgi:hypothetical protein